VPGFQITLPIVFLIWSKISAKCHSGIVNEAIRVKKAIKNTYLDMADILYELSK